MSELAISDEFSITRWLDPVLGWFAEQGGLNRDDYVSQTGGEALAVAVEFVSDLFFKTLTSKLIQGGIGIGLGAYGIWGPGIGTRLKKDLIAMGNHMMFRLADPKPSDMIEMRAQVDEILSAAKLGDPNLLGGALLRSVGEIMAGFEALGIPTGLLPQAKTGSPVSLTTPVKKFASF